jgi:predicted adenylyl cyclase CyaB
MPRNVEIKARVASLAALEPRVAALGTSGPVVIDQDDTFFRCPGGRLKLRVIGDESGELIFYRRADVAGPKESFYVVSRTAAPGTLREVLAQAYGVEGRVVKRRTLYRVGRTRVHLDRVESLGEFLELEVVLGEGEPAEAGVREARALVDRLGVDAASLVEGAYLDLLIGRGT